MTIQPMTRPYQMDGALALSRWLIALITAGLPSDEALQIISKVQRDQFQVERKAA